MNIRYKDKPEVSLIVPDFIISLYSSSCNYHILDLMLAPWLFLSIFFGIPKAGWDGKE